MRKRKGGRKKGYAILFPIVSTLVRAQARGKARWKVHSSSHFHRCYAIFLEEREKREKRMGKLVGGDIVFPFFLIRSRVDVDAN